MITSRFVYITLLCTALSAAVQAHNAEVYRGVNAKANGNASLAPSQFNFNPSLSVFSDPAQAPVQKPCNFRFTVTGLPNADPHVGDSGDVEGLAGYTATFNNHPAGHWDILRPVGITAAAAAQQVSVYAKATRAERVVNGTQDNCY